MQMKYRRIVFFTGFVWELGRFAFLFITANLYLMDSPSGNLLFLLLLSAPQLLLAAGFLALWRDEARYASSIPLLAMGKFLNLFPEIFYLVLYGGVFPVFSLLAGFSQTSFLMENGNWMLIAFIAVCAVDLIFFVFLLSYRTPKTEKKRDNGGYSDFPIVDIVRVEEEE